MQTPRSIFALLVGINDYPQPRNRLEGCVRDVHRVQEYLEAHFNNDAFVFKPKVLTDQEATRAGIISGFEHFQQAKDGDICLFHYSGHGSRCPAPPAFWHLEPDKKHESIVCYDSRAEGGRDLFDKELSYLIWTATHGKDIHFVAVLDCCHSGTATRTTYSRPRQLHDREDGTAIEDYLGFEFYKKSGDTDYSPPRGRHVLLAAARARETAKEVYAGGEACGIFTYSLLEALKGAHNQLTYSELVNRVNIRVRNKVSEQSPQLESFEPEDKRLFFLTGTPSSEGATYLVGYDRNKKSWIVNAGALHGIVPGNESSKTVLKLLGNGGEAVVREVFPHYSTLDGMQGFPEEQSFTAMVKEMASPRLPVAFDKENEPDGELLLRKHLNNKPGAAFQLVDEPEQASYLIHAKYGHYFLSKLDEAVPKAIGEKHPLDKIRSVFQKVAGYSDPSAIEFLNNMESVNRWAQILELSNPNTGIRDEELEIQLFRAVEPGNYENDVKVKAEDWGKPVTLAYQQHGGEWRLPAVQFKVKNAGRRPLWVSLLFLGGDFAVTNKFMPAQELAPGEEAWALDVFDGHPYKTIPIKMEDAFNRWGITDIEEYMKLFICTEEFNTDELNQEGLKLDEPAGYPKRAAGRFARVPRPDWAAKDIRLHIHRPLEAKEVKVV